MAANASIATEAVNLSPPIGAVDSAESAHRTETLSRGFSHRPGAA